MRRLLHVWQAIVGLFSLAIPIFFIVIIIRVAVLVITEGVTVSSDSEFVPRDGLAATIFVTAILLLPAAFLTFKWLLPGIRRLRQSFVGVIHPETVEPAASDDSTEFYGVIMWIIGLIVIGSLLAIFGKEAIGSLIQGQPDMGSFVFATLFLGILLLGLDYIISWIRGIWRREITGV